MYDNPVATTPVPAAFPAGPYDERFGVKDGELTRLCAGPKLLEIEKREKELGLKPRDPFGFRAG